MIDWNKVVPHETVLVDTRSDLWLVLCIDSIAVWLRKVVDNTHITQDMPSLTLWSIYDPWEDVTAECSLRLQRSGPNAELRFVLYHGSIDIFGGRCDFYKVEGLQVWRRNEKLDLSKLER